MTNYFPSAKSTSLGLILWGAILIPFGFILPNMLESATRSDLLILIFIMLLIVLFVAVTWFGTGYYVTGKEIIIKVGPVTHSVIELSKITHIERSKSIISSPATSLNRLAIKSGERLLVLISPKDEEEFIQLVKKANPEIHLDI